MQTRLTAIVLLCLPALAAAADPAPTRSNANTAAASTKASPTQSAEVIAADRAVERQVGAIQNLISREERKLESRMAQLAKQRKIALEKTDARQLKRIEQLEQQAIQAYEQQLQRIIRSAAIKGSSPSSTRAKASPRSQRSNNGTYRRQSRKSSPPQRQAKRFRLLPF